MQDDLTIQIVFKKASSVDRRQLLKQGSLAFGLVSSLQTVTAQTRTFNIGVLPHASARTIATQYEPLQGYLGQKLDATVMVSSAPDWAAFYRNVKNEQYDLVIAAAHVARLMQIDLGLQMIASYQPKIKGLFITSSSQIAVSPLFIKGKPIALANPASLVAFEAEKWFEGYRMKAGVDYKLLEVRGGDSVGPSILRGETAAGIISQGDFQLQPNHVKSQLHIINTFAEVPNFVVLTSKRLSEAAGLSLSKQLHSFSESEQEGKTFQERTGFKITAQINDTDMKAMDVFLDKTRRLLA
jgi:phosphonate transport system substrate-binding protein